MSRLVFGWLTGFVAGLPLRMGYAVASWLTELHFRLFPARRHAALANLAAAMPGTPRRERRCSASEACRWSPRRPSGSFVARGRSSRPGPSRERTPTRTSSPAAASGRVLTFTPVAFVNASKSWLLVDSFNAE